MRACIIICATIKPINDIPHPEFSNTVANGYKIFLMGYILFSILILREYPITPINIAVTEHKINFVRIIFAELKN